jgi:hypothetical protein
MLLSKLRPAGWPAFSRTRMTLIGHDHDPQHDCTEVGGHQPAPPAPRRGAAWLFSSPIRVVLLAAVGVYLVDAGGTDDGPGLCVFRRCTGGYCPGCGLSRATKHLSRGNIGAAWQDHPWVVLAAVQALALGAVWAVIRQVGTIVNTRKLAAVVFAVNVSLLLGIWVVRLIDGSIPRFF